MSQLLMYCSCTAPAREVAGPRTLNLPKSTVHIKSDALTGGKVVTLCRTGMPQQVTCFLCPAMQHACHHALQKLRGASNSTHKVKLASVAAMRAVLRQVPGYRDLAGSLQQLNTALALIWRLPPFRHPQAHQVGANREQRATSTCGTTRPGAICVRLDKFMCTLWHCGLL